jgi:hypothetical protein
VYFVVVILVVKEKRNDERKKSNLFVVRSVSTADPKPFFNC